MALKVTAPELKAAADDFDGIAGELKASIDKVDNANQNLKPHFAGEAANAFDSAINDRFHPAALKLKNALDDIAKSLHSGSVQYGSVTEEQASQISHAANAMNI
jgi:WXG100 family type VII secretion target